MAYATAPCPACERGEHDDCWEVDPPDALRPIDLACPCPHDRTGRAPVAAVGVTPAPDVRFVVQMHFEQVGGWGWTVWDRKEGTPAGGWFARDLRHAAEQTAAVFNGAGR